MDTFMDKLAQKLTAQEMITANTVAETEEFNRLREQVRQYQDCLDQMREVNQELRVVNDQMNRLVSDEIAPEITRLVDQGVLKMEDVKIDTTDIQRLVQEGCTHIQEIAEESDAQLQRTIENSDERLRRASEAGNAQLQRLSDTGTSQMMKIAEDSQAQLQQIVTDSSAALQKFSEESILKLQKLSELGNSQLQKLSELSNVQLQKLSDESNAQLQRVAMESSQRLREFQQNGPDLEELKQVLQEKTEASNEYVHRECVKVYRNVQAVIAEENAKQTEVINETIRDVKSKMSIMMTVSAGALAASVAAAVLQLLSLFHIL